MKIIELNLESFKYWKETISILFKEAVVVNFPYNQPDEVYYTESINKLMDYIEVKSATVFLGISDEKALGMVWCHPIQRFNKRRLHIASIAVLPEARKLGIGNALLERVERFAVQNGYAGIDLLVTAENLNAVGFYQNNGFETERLLMKKDL